MAMVTKSNKVDFPFSLCHIHLHARTHTHAKIERIFLLCIFNTPGCPDKFRLVDNMCFLVIQEILKIGKLTEKCQVLGGAHLAEFNTKEQFHSMKKFIEGM